MPKTVRYAIAGFFLLNTANFLLRPIRDGIGIQLGASLLPYLFLCTLVLMLALAIQFGRRTALRSWLARFYGLFCIWLGVFLFAEIRSLNGPALNACFFVSISVFNLFSISLLWSELVSRFEAEDAGQLFGKIATGLAVGAIVGSTVSSLLVNHIGREGMIGLAIPAILISFWIQRHLILQKDVDQQIEKQNYAGGRLAAFKELFRIVRQSPLLRASAIQIFLYGMINTFFYFEQLELVIASSLQPLEQVRLLANIALIIHVASFLLQWFGFQHLVRRFSKKQLLVVIPMTVGIFLFFQFLSPVFWILVMGMTLHKVGSYALVRPLREVLHTQLKPRAKYGAKNLVDTVFSRSGDVAGSWIYDLVFVGLSHPISAALISIPISGWWVWNSWYLAKISEPKLKDHEASIPK
ncbi:NTP/NDP exchange transporter [Flavilitoribacter nigricans]|uniref:MFS transporter n=1 Tax=Flavilitoribacter nigricans (strain ATCC 23147 / DSM 23189 / NBRC 102662 / NCIMB 1420 / SS-2) TaxID=1122177 RepID=A0A2D0NCK6_FLAN2|nr:MFS transporter [Flavilitoribacter nigricans]PHN06217.1 hypothetical protein CRP01_11585 [Flavilitoribacter nigricans DSM 23189 = NBRC 102662]